MLIFHFSRFSESIYLQEWLVSFSHLNEVLNAEHVSVGDKYVLADQRNQESASPIMTPMIFRYEVPGVLGLIRQDNCALNTCKFTPLPVFSSDAPSSS